MEQPRHTHAVASPDAPPATPPEPPPQHADGAALAQSAALALGAPAAFVALDHGDGLRLVGTEGPMLPGDWLGALYAAAASHPGPLVVADLAGGAPDAPPSGAAAVALRAPDGTARGVLGVLMDGAGALTDARLQALDALARVAAETFGLAPPAEAVPTEGDGLLQSLRGFLPRLTVAHASERETALYRAFYEAILEQSPTDIIVVDHEGRYVHLSARKDRDDEMRAWLMGKTIIDYCARVGLDESIGRAVRDTEEEVVRTGRPHTLDLVLPGSTGPRHVARLAGPVHDRTGRVTHVVWHSVNVTERHLAETALARSEARYRALVDATGAAVWVAPASGEIVEEVPGWENITGQAADDQLGWGWLDAVHPDDRTRLGDAWQHAIETGAPFDATYRMRDRTSGYRDARTRAVRVAHADGGVEWVGMRVDVTAERAAERVLRESEERFRHLAESTPNGLVVTDADGRMTFVNREVERLFGYARGELVGQPVEALMPEADRRGHERLRAEYAADPSPRHLETGREVLGRRKDGSTFPIDVGLVPFEAGGGTGVLATIVDLTARRAAEEALRESEERLQTVIENLDEGLIIADLAGNVLHWNHAALTLHGFTSVEEGQRALPEFQDIFELLTPEGAVVPYDEWPMPRIFRGEALSGLVLRLRRVDTDWERTFRYGGTTALDAGGRPVIFLTVTDVTEQCAAEAALLARMAELQAITDHADDLILRFDRDLRYVFANPATLHVLGVPPEALIGRTDAELARDPALAAEREVYLRRVFETGEPAAYEVDVPLPDGGRLVLHLHALPERRDAGGRVETVLVIARNVTAQRAADDTLRARATELQAITDHTDDVIVRFDRDHRYLFVNAALERLTGRTAAEFVGTPLEAGLSPELIARWTSGLREVFATGTPLDVPYTLQTPAGPRRFLARVAPETFDAGGRVETVLVVARDFTALHDTTAALRARAAELQTITHHTEDLIIRYDRALRHLYINPALERLTGFPPEHFLGKTNVEIGLPPGHAEGYAAALREVLETGEPADFTFDAPRPDGTTGHLVARMVPDTRDAEGRVETVLAVTRDFTALHEATRAVRERAAELQAITDHAEDVITRFDRDLHYLFVNPAIERFTGLQPEAFLGRKLREREIGGADLEPWAREIEAVFATGEPRDAAFESVTPTGPRYIHARIVPERKADGHVETVLVVTRDVTAEHAAAEALRESERRFREVVESAPGGIVVADLAGRITLVNRRAEALFGYMRGELIGGPVERLALAGVAGPGGAPSAGADLYARRKDGSTFPVEIALTPIETETGPAVLTTVIDVTQRKAAEAALRASEERMRGVLEATPDAFFAVDSDWRFTYVNPHAEALWGVAPGALLGQALPKAFPGFTTTPFYRAYACVMETRVPAVVTAQAAGGGRWYEAHAFPYETGLAVFFNDVTARKTAEAALVRKEAETRRLGMVAARTTNGVLIADAEGQIEWVNEGFTRMSGYAPDEVVGQPLGDVLRGPDTDPDRAALLQGHLILGEGFTAEVVNYRKDGTPYWVHLDAQPLRDAAGRLTGFIRIDTDVTARKRAEDALRENEGRFRRATEAAHVGVFELDLATRALQWSAHTYALFGLDADGPPLTLARFLSLVHADDRDAVARLITAAVSPSAPQRFEGQCRVVWPDDTIRWLSLRGDVVHEGTGDERRPARLTGVALDVTERQRYEEELVAAREQAEEAARLKSAFLANMSHEIRTPLTGIIGFAEVLGEEVSGEAAEFAGLIRRSGQRLLETLNSVLDLARLEAAGLALNARPTDLAAAVRDAATLYGGQAEERGLRLAVEAPTLVPVLADEGALARVLANLLSNALKFTPRGEVSLHVSTEGAPGTAGGYGVVVVADTGTGIAPAFIPHLFDEFEQESTGIDRTYEGAGLGLTLTKRLVELMGGTIGVESEKGVGSTFTVRLPLA